MMTFIFIIVGLALLFAGRKLFWLAVASIGFIAGMKLATIFIEVQSESTLILISMGIGILSAMAAIVVQKVAVALAGFAAAGYGAFIGMKRLGLDFGEMNWIPILLLGLIGVFVAAIVFGWTLILLSSLVGAYLIVSQLHMNHLLDGTLFVVLSVAGIVIQAKSRKKKRPEKEKDPGTATSK